MKKKMFSNFLFFSLLLVFCYYPLNINADDKSCNHNKYTKGSWIAGIGDDTFYPVLKTVLGLDESLSSVKSNYTNVKFSISSVKDNKGNLIDMSNLRCSNDNSTFKDCSSVYLTISDPIFIKLKKSYSASKMTIKFVGNEETSKVDSSTEGYCSKDITITIEYDGFNNTPQISSVSYKYEPNFEKSFGREFKCDKASYKDSFEEDFCRVKKNAETINDVSKVKVLSCDYKTIYSNQKDLVGQNYYRNTKYLYHSGDVAIIKDKKTGEKYSKEKGKYILGYLTYSAAGISKKDPITCKKTCQEAIEVKYGPPVASKAGMCFEYKVKVISRVNCYSEFDYAPIRNDIGICTPSPVCFHDGDEYRTAGPDESFDNCIKRCDGGKYTSKCSKQCYNEVYGKTSSNMTSNLNYINANKLVSEKCSGKGENSLCSSNCVYCSNGEKYSDSEITYSSKYESEPVNKRGFYYRGLDCKSEICWYGEENVDDNHGYLGNDGYRFFPFAGYVAGRWYGGTTAWGDDKDYGVYQNDGFYRAGVSTDYCHDNCYWQGCSAPSYLNEGDYYYTVNKNKKTLEAAKKKCMVSSVCTTSTKDIVTFTIKAGSTTIPSSNPDNIQYKDTGWISDTRKDGSTLMYDTFDDNTLVSCYDNKNNKFFSKSAKVNNGVSIATWHFPGTWFDPKTNLMSYTPHDNWYEVKDKYCTSTETKDVNVEYWNYYVNKIMKDDSKKSEEDRKYEQKIFGQYDKQCKNVGKGTISDPINITDDSYHPSMNIVASTRGFGFFGWNIDVNCFYALNTCLNGYKIRSVSTADLFPSKEGTPITKDEKIGREPGYNWSNSSIVSKNENYVVNPPRLITEVQHFGQAGKDAIYKDENLEYSFNLSSLDMKSIRDKFESEKSENYNIYNGKVYDPNKKSDLKVIYNGIPRYKSDLIEDLVKSGKGKRPPGDGFICNNIKNLSTGECDDYSSYKPASTK